VLLTRRLILLGLAVIALGLAVIALDGVFVASVAGSGAPAPCSGVTPENSQPWSNVLRGDVTGDGRPDLVFVGQHYPAKLFCQRALFVRSGSRTYMAAITQQDITNWPANAGGPEPVALDDIDTVRGAEVLLRLNMSGDGHSQIGVYTFRDGRIVRYRMRDVPGTVVFFNAFSVGGSICCIYTFACIKRHAGQVVQTFAGPVHGGRRFEAGRFFLSAQGLRFVVTHKQRGTVRDLGELSEFRRGADKCVVAVARSPNLPHNPKEPLPG
jgi:hypothetical protein